MEAIIQNDPKSARLNETNDYLIQVLAKSKLYSLNIYIYIYMISRDKTSRSGSLCAACSQNVIPHVEAIIDNLTVAQLIQESSSLYETPKFIIVFTTSRH